MLRGPVGAVVLIGVVIVIALIVTDQGNFLKGCGNVDAHVSGSFS